MEGLSCDLYPFNITPSTDLRKVAVEGPFDPWGDRVPGISITVQNTETKCRNKGGSLYTLVSFGLKGSDEDWGFYL